MNKIYEDLTLLHRRSRIFYILIIVMFFILVLALWKIQILDHGIYWAKSEANRINELVRPSQRGLILARDGQIMAKNIASFKASLIQENSEDIDNSYQKISNLLNLDY